MTYEEFKRKALEYAEEYLRVMEYEN